MAAPWTVTPDELCFQNEIVESLTSISSDQMYSFLLALEGQRLFELVGELSATVEIDHTPYQWPNGRAFSIRDLKVGRDGQRLSNTMQPQLNSICSRVTCEDVSAYCSDPIQLIGHCCPVCGAVAVYRCADAPNFYLIQLGIRLLEKMYPNHVGISQIRLDQEADHPAYQLSVIPDKSENYVEDEFYDALQNGLYYASHWYTKENVQMFDMHIVYSTQRSKIHFGKILKNILYILTGLFLGSALFAVEYKRNARLRLWIGDRLNERPQIRVVFQRGADLVHLWQEQRRRSHTNQDDESGEGEEKTSTTTTTTFENLVFGRDDPADIDFEPSTSETRIIDDGSESVPNSDYLSISNHEL